MKTFRSLFAACVASIGLLVFPASAAPTITGQPQSLLVVADGASPTLSVTATGTSGGLSYQWQRNGVNVGTNSSSLALASVQAANAGIYRVIVTESGAGTGAGTSTTSANSIVTIGSSSSSTKILSGSGTEVGSNLVGPSGSLYDEVLLTGAAVTVTADAGQATRVTFVDDNDDIVNVEFSGAGVLTIALDNATGPAEAVNYNQSGVNYWKGHANLLVTGADALTNLYVASVGTANTTNQAIFKAITYDGIADIGYVSVVNSTQFGGLRTGNARYTGSAHPVGILASGVLFSSTVRIQDLDASGTADPFLTAALGTSIEVVGGNLSQTNARRISAFAGIPTFVAGTNSHGVALPQLANAGTFGPLVVTQNPSLGTAVQAGTSVGLTVTLTGTTGPVSVQWYKQGVLIPGSTTTPDATGVARYFLGVLNSPADQGPFSAVATDDTGASAPLVLRDYQYVVDRVSFSWRHPFPAGIPLSAVAVANEGDFLLMGARGYFASSMDGSGGWEQSPSFTSDTVGGYAFGNNRHVIRTSSGRFLSLAPHGSDRVASGLPAGFGCSELIFAQGLFVALGNFSPTSGKIFTSPDGIVWTERYAGAEQLFEATFGNGKFAVSTASGKILLSADGLTWSAPAASPLSAVWMLRYANDRFFLGGAAGELYSSVDGTNWGTPLTSGISARIMDLAYDGAGRYVLVGDADGIRTSTNGVDWAAATITPTPSGINPNNFTTTTTNLASVAFSKGNWIIVGNNNNGQNTSVVLRSTDNGATWNKQNGTVSLQQYNGIASHDSGDASASIVAVGNGGTIVRSTDGWTWNNVTSGTGSNFNEVTYKSAYFAAGASGLVKTSTDQGQTWTTLATGITNTLLWIGDLNGKLHVVGQSGAMRRYDGSDALATSWTAITTGTTQQLNGAAYGAPAATPSYVAVGNAGTILRSADGVTWGAITSGTTQNLNEVTFAAGKFVAVGNAGTILYSTDGGTSWTSSSIPTISNCTHVTFTNGQFMVSGSESAVMVSSDGINWKAKLTHTSAAGLIRAAAAYGGRLYGVGAGGSILAADLIPQIDQVTVTENVTTGGTAKFTVDYFDPLLDTTIQWTKGGFNIPGATGPTYTIPATTRADAGAYAATLTTTARATGSDPVLLAVAPTQQPGVFTADPTFNPDPLTISTRVYAGLKLSNNPNMAGKWLAGGEFVRWDNSARAGLARLNADLTLDTTYTPPVFNGFVLALAEAPDGSVYVGGDFTAVDGHLRNGLARLKPDLTLDLAWQPADGAPRSQVTALAVGNNGKVLVARSSGNGAINGTNVVRRLLQNGTLDPDFSVDITLGTGRIFNLIVESSGAVVIGGQFALGTHLHIARVDAMGAVDATFAGSTGADDHVFAVKRLADGRYLVGGRFANIGGSARNRVAIINDATGALDAYTPATGFAGGAGVRGLTVLNGGDLLLGGDFTSYGGTSTWGLIRLNGTTGAVVQGYTTTGTAVGFPATGAGRFLDLFTRPDGSVAIFGGFQSVLNQRRVGVAALNPDGTLSATPNSLLYRPAYANNVIVEADGNLTLGGSIDSVGGAGGKFASVRLSPSGGVVSGYPVGTGFTPNGLSVFELYRLLRQADGKTLAVGDITGYNGTASNRLVRLNADGTADTSFNAGTGPGSIFPGIVPLMGGKTLLYNFSGSYNGATGLGPIIRLNPDGTRDTTFAAASVAGLNSVFEFPDADGTLVATGLFTTYNGQPAPGIAVISAMGGLITDANIGSGVTPSGTINGMTVIPSGDVGYPVFFGNFTTFNGVTVNRIAIHDDTQPNLLRAGFMAASVIDGPVGQVIVQEDGKLIVVGDFTGSPIYRLMPNGDVDPTFAVRGITSIVGGNGAALRVAIGPDGSLYLYGTPISINYGAPRSVVKFSAAPVPATIAVPPSGSEVSLNGSTILSVKAAGTAPFTYQWKLNGSDVPGATGSVLVLNNIQSGNLGDYSVVVSNGVGTPATSAAVAVNLGNPPMIATHPANAAVVPGGNLMLSVTATGSGPFSYQWKFNGGDILNANGPKLNLSGIQPGQYGNYTVVVTNPYGSTPSNPGVVSAAPTASAFVNHGNFTRPEFRHNVIPGRTTYGPASGKIYASFVNGDNLTGADNQRVGSVIRLNENGQVDSSFNIGAFLSTAWAVAEQSDGKVLVGGVASHENDISGPQNFRIWRFNPNGTVDPSYKCPILETLPRYLALQPDGKLIVGANGLFEGNGGVGSKLFRLNPDGTKDLSFTDPVLPGSSVVFASILVDSQNRIVFGGTFNSVNGVARQGLARLLPDGTLDTTFVPAGYTLGGQVRGLGFQTQGANAGKILVAGGNFNISGTNYAIIRLNANGSLDVGFTKQTNTTLGISSGRPRLLNVLPDDTFTVVSNSVTRFLADGTIDTGYTRALLSAESFWMETLPDGRVILNPELGMTVNGNPVTSLVRLSNTGAVDGTFTPGQFQTEIYPQDGALLPNGKTLTWGLFDTVGTTARRGAARFNADGTLDSGFNITGIPNLLGIVDAFVQPDGGLIASTLTGASQSSGTGGLTRVDNTGAVVGSFVPDATILAAAASGSFDLFGQPDGKVIVTSQSPQQVLDGAIFVRRMNPDGSLDSFSGPSGAMGAVFRDTGGNITSITTGAFRILGRYPDGRLIAATTAAPYTAQPTSMNWTLVRLSAAGVVDPSFNAPLVAAPTFSSFPTLTTARTPSVVTQQVLSYFPETIFRGVLPQADGSVIVYGGFSTIGGQPAPGIARLTNLGLFDETFTVGSGAESRSQPGRQAGIGGVTLDSAGRYWVTGLFDTFGGRAAPGIVRLNANGMVDPNFATTLGFQPYIGGLTKTLLRSDNEAVVFGTFARSNDPFPNAVNTILVPAPASFGPLPPAQILLQGQSVTLNANVQGVPQPDLQWRLNGSAISGATGPSYLVNGTAGVYDVVGSNFYGSATSMPAIISYASAGGDTFPNFAWRNPLPIGGTLKGVVYANGQFVGVGTAGRVMTSTDGVSWTPAANNAALGFNAVTFSTALNLYIAVGQNGDIYTAPANAVGTWTKSTTTTFDWLNGVAVGTVGSNPMVVAVGFNGRIVTSSNATTWAAQQISGNPTFNAVAATADLFVAVGNNGVVYTSTNGTSWSAATVPAGLTSAQFNGVRYLNGQFVAVGSGGAIMTWTGTGSWTQVTGVNRSLRDIAAIGTTYVAATDNGVLVKGENLANWQVVNLPTYAAHFGIAASGTTFATVGSGVEIWTSSDSTTWTSRYGRGGLWRFGAVEFVNGRFVAVGSAGSIYTSLDADNWTRASTPTSSWLDSVTYGNGLYVVPSDSGDILTSPDIVTWTSRTVGDFVNNNGVAYDGTTFVVVGDNGKIRTSANGTDWTNVTGTGITANLRTVAARPGLFVAAGDNGKIYTSANGTTWVERTSNTTQRLWRVRLIEGTFFAMGDNRTLLASSDGTTWVPLPISTNLGYSYRDIQRLSDGFYVAGDQNILIKSADLKTATAVLPSSFGFGIAAGESINGFAVGAGRAVLAGEGGALLESVLPAASATPAITVQPTGVTTDATKSVVLSVVANASGPLTYQWKQGTTDIPGATSSTLLIPAAATSATGSYTVVVTSGANSVTSDPAVVTVNALAAPAITALPIGAQVVTGTASLSVTATGTAPLTYQWYRGVSGDTSNPVSTNASFTTAALTQTERYWVKITNFADQVLNSPTTSAVAIAPRNGPLASVGVSGIAYSGSKYAAVAGTAILTSSDGSAWTRIGGLTGSFFNQIAYGNSNFVAVGNSGAIRLSTDNGVTWTTSNVGTTNFNGVCFDGTQFVAVGASGVVATSPNGTSWTTRTALSGAPTMRAVAFINGVYVAVGDNGAIQTSDGVYNGGTQPTWTVRSSGTGNALRALAANGASPTAKIVVVGDNGTVRVSTDTTNTASTWTAVNSPSGGQINGVVFANSKFIAVTGAQFMTSTDGSNWGTATFPVLPLGNLGVNSIVYAGGRYVIGGFPGVIMTSDTGNDGTWTLRSGATSAMAQDVIHGGGVYLAVGNNGAILRSADGINFDVKSPAVAGLDFLTLRRAAYGKGTFVVVGDSGTILSSPDGQLWIQRASGGSAYLAAAYGNNKFVVAGGGGVFATSSDGATWTTGVGTIGLSNVTALTYGAGVFVAVNNTGGIHTSADGASWTPRTSGVAVSLNNVTFAGGQFVAVGASSTVLTSPDGITWTARTLGTSSINLSGIAYGDGMYFATHAGQSNSTLIFASPNGITWNSANVSGGVVGAFATTTVAYGNGAFLIAGGNALLAQTIPAPEVPRITVQPASQSITGGQTVTLSVTAVGSSPTYQWYEGATGDVSVPVSTNATFTTPALVQSKRYWVRVTAGGQTFESDTAQLLGPPAIISAPTSRMVNDGTVLTLSVNAIGAAPLSYVWKYNNTTIPGANGPTYTLNPVSLSNAGNYSVTVSNIAGIASTSNAAISVAPVAPTVGSISSTYGRNIPVGANTELSVSVVGTPTLSYQWRRNTTPIPGATKSTYFITNAKATDSGTYSVVVTNAQGNGTSSDFGLVVTPELGWQWRNPLPTGNGLSSVTAINNKFYLGGLRSTMLVSDNGTTWAPQAIAGTGNIFSVAHGAGRIVALGGLNAIYTSDDGVTWTPRDSKVQDTNSLQSVAFGAGRFVAVGFNGRTTTSEDGITWTPGQVPTSVANDYLYWIRYVEGKFWVSSSDDNTVRTWTSTDGLNWTQPALTLPANMFVGQVAFGNGVYVATTEGDFLWSSDGVTWTAAGFGPVGDDLPTLRYVNDRFIAVGTNGAIATSTNGQAWTPQVSGVAAGLSDVAFANGTYVISGGNPRTILTSADAVNWTQIVTGPAQTTPLLAVASGNGKLVAVGNSGTIVTSADGLAWTAATSGVVNNLLDVAYGANVFVAVGAGGRVLTAPGADLATWTTRTSNTSSNLRRVSFANNRFVAVSDSGVSLVSSDGISWTANSATAGSFFGTAFGAGVQVAVGNNGGLFSSADNGATWTNRAGSLINTGYSDVLFANGKFVTVGLGGVAATSTDGLIWSQVPAFTTDNLNGLVFANGFWMATGSGSTYYVSSDGVNWSPRYTGAQDTLRDFVVYGNQVIGVGNNGTIIAAGAPVFVSPPVNTAARAGGSVTLRALVGASPFPVSYQWQKDGSNLSDGTGISGSTTPNLTLTGITLASAGQYRLVATNAIAPVTSPAAQLAVSQAPTFTSSPANFTAVAGQGASFTASAVGTPAPTYQWQKDNVNLANGTLPNGTVVAGATTGTLILSNVQPEAVGSYRLIATNTPAGESSPVSEPSLPATLAVNVLPAPVITSAVPAIASGTVTLIAGDNANDDVTFTATATGTAPLNYQWRRNGLNLANGTFVSGATTNTLTLSNVPLNGGGNITVAVSNAATAATGPVVSAPVSLVVNPPAPVIISPLSVSGVINTPFTYGIGINATTATFGATNLPPGLTVNTSTGVISGVPTATGVYNTIALTATNTTNSDTKTLTITINPPPPIITSPVAATGRVNQGTALTYTIVATNGASVTATPLPPGLTLSGNVISGTPTQAGTFTTTITATNATGSATQTVTFTIDPALNAPVYTGSTQPSGTQNSSFTFQPVFTNVNATNGYAITNGTLPAGIQLNANTGALTGTPTAVGSFPVTLTATGPGGSLSVVLTIVINPAPTAPLVNSAASAAGTKGELFSYTITTDVPATSYTAVVVTASGTEALPGWLSLSGNVLSGTPPAAGTLSLQIAATAGSLTGPGKLVIVTISPSPLAPVITSSPYVSNSTSGRVGETTTAGSPLYQIAATNPTITLYERTAGVTLESFGLQLDTGTGAVYGTPTTSGIYKVWFAASNAAGGRGPSMEVTFAILPAANVPVITSNGTAAGQVGQSFSYAISATNAPTSYADTGLPANGLTRTGNLISGIPTTATVQPLVITVSAANADGTSVPKTVSITIAPAPATPVITSAGTASGRVNSTFTPYQMTASESPTSFKAVNLPPGLGVNPTTGVISGTPTQAGTFTATLSAANAAGLGVTSPLVFSIAPAPAAPAITSAPSATGKVGVDFTYTTTATNGPITNYAVNGTLPLGLGLNTTTGVISGTPVEPGFKVVDLTATSANGTSLPQSLIIVIDPADNVPVITSPIYSVGTVGVDFTYTIAATNMPGGTPFPAAVTLDAVDLPPGLAVNPSTGVIQGQPSLAGVFVATLVGTNASGTGPARSLTIFVQPAAAAPVVTSGTTAAAQVGVGFSYQITATNNPLGYEVLGAPAWMTVNGQSGALGGTPTMPGTFAVLLVANNSAGASSPAPLALLVAAAANTPVVTSTRSASGTMSTDFSYTIQATNTPTSYLATGLPSGLTLNSATGAITGRPNASGTYQVTISASNANGAGQPVVLTLTIAPNLQIVL